FETMTLSAAQLPQEIFFCGDCATMLAARAWAFQRRRCCRRRGVGAGHTNRPDRGGPKAIGTARRAQVNLSP
ncbi:MAG: hypothetical protein WA763_16625, partial [Pseudolabrys sp.]